MRLTARASASAHVAAIIAMQVAEHASGVATVILLGYQTEHVDRIGTIARPGRLFRREEANADR